MDKIYQVDRFTEKIILMPTVLISFPKSLSRYLNSVLRPHLGAPRIKRDHTKKNIESNLYEHRVALGVLTSGENYIHICDFFYVFLITIQCVLNIVLNNKTKHILIQMEFLPMTGIYIPLLYYLSLFNS